MAAIKSGRFRNLGTGDLAFVSRGYWNWKDATGNKGAFNTHERSNTHKMAVDHLLTLPSTTHDVGEMLFFEHACEKLANRDYLQKFFQYIQFLARQGMAMRGDLDEIDGNFTQLLMLRSIDDPAIIMELEKNTDQYTSPQIQNEILSILALCVLRSISEYVKSASFYSPMANEVADSLNRE